MTYQEKMSVREKILERMDPLQHFFELEDYKYENDRHRMIAEYRQAKLIAGDRCRRFLR